MWAGVSKSGSPISRWMISLPCRSRAFARARTSNADSVPSRDIRSAKFMVAPILGDVETRIYCLVDLVEVPAGWFWMGWERGHPGERPAHRVWLDRFAIARAPVTNREYAAFLAATAPRRRPGGGIRASTTPSSPWSG